MHRDFFHSPSVLPGCRVAKVVASHMGGSEKGCDAQSAAVFIIGLVAGTGCIIVAKMLFEMKAVGSTGELEVFNPPVRDVRDVLWRFCTTRGI